MSVPSFGPGFVQARLRIPPASAFADTVNRKLGWFSEPQIEFPRDGAVWQSTLDPENSKTAAFSESRVTAGTREHDEEWLLRDTHTDVVLAGGRVMLQAID